MALLTARVKVLEEALKPFAKAASAFLFSLGPNGIDDGLTVDVSVACRPERETTLSTTDFSNAAAALNASAGKEGQCDHDWTAIKGGRQCKRCQGVDLDKRTCPKCGASAVAFICNERGCPVNGGSAHE